MELQDNEIMKKIMEGFNSIRAFARYINEDPSDVSRWLHGERKLHPRVVIKMCRMFDCNAHDLRDDIFPSDVKIVFKK